MPTKTRPRRLAKGVVVRGCGAGSVQGDVAFAHVLERMGATVEWSPDSTKLASASDDIQNVTTLDGFFQVAKLKDEMVDTLKETTGAVEIDDLFELDAEDLKKAGLNKIEMKRFNVRKYSYRALKSSF